METKFSLKVLVMVLVGLGLGVATDSVLGEFLPTQYTAVAGGGFHGLALVGERFFEGKLNIPDSILIRGLRMLLVFAVVTFAWLLFK